METTDGDGSTDLPADRSYSRDGESRTKTATFPLTSGENAGALVAVLQVILSRHSRREDVVLTAVRPDPAEPVILRGQVNETATFADLVADAERALYAVGEVTALTVDTVTDGVHDQVAHVCAQVLS